MQFQVNAAFSHLAWFYAWMTENPIWLGNSAHLLADLPVSKDPLSVLDLGSGPGNSALAMGRSRPETNFIALDISFPMLELVHHTRARAGWTERRLAPLQGDAYHIPLADGRVDAVTGHSFLYLLPNVHEVLVEVHRVLRPGGVVAFLEPMAGDPDWGWLLRQPSSAFILSIVLWRFYSRLHRRFSATVLETNLCQAGFHQVYTEATLGNFGLFGRGEKP